MNKEKSISAFCEVIGVKTLSNGLTRVTFDLQDGQIEETAVLLAFWKHSPYGNLTFKVEGDKESEGGRVL